MINLINLNPKWLNHVLVDKLKVFMPNPMLDIAAASSEKVVDDNHLSSSNVIHEIRYN